MCKQVQSSQVRLIYYMIQMAEERSGGRLKI